MRAISLHKTQITQIESDQQEKTKLFGFAQHTLTHTSKEILEKYIHSQATYEEVYATFRYEILFEEIITATHIAIEREKLKIAALEAKIDEIRLNAELMDDETCEQLQAQITTITH